jgi:flagellar hook protein FlgE
LTLFKIKKIERIPKMTGINTLTTNLQTANAVALHVDGAQFPLNVTDAHNVTTSLTRKTDEFGADTFDLNVMKTALGEIPAEPAPTPAMPEHFPMTLTMPGDGFMVLQDMMNPGMNYLTKSGLCQLDCGGQLMMHSNFNLRGWQFNTTPMDPPPPPPMYDQASLTNVMLMGPDFVYKQTDNVTLSLNLKQAETEGAVSVFIGPAQADLANALGNPATWPVHLNLQVNQDAPISVVINNTDTIFEVVNAINAVDPARVWAHESNGKLVVQPMMNQDSITLSDTGAHTAATNLFGASPTIDHGIDFHHTVQIVSANGVANDIDLQFKKSFDNQWYVEAHHTSANAMSNPSMIGWADLTFDGAGNLTMSNGDLITGANINWPNAGSQWVNFNFASVTQLAVDYSSNPATHDGQATAYRTSLELTNDGFLRGGYNDGVTRDLWKLAAGTFTNEATFLDPTKAVYQENTDTAAMPMTLVEMGTAGTSVDKS